MTRLPVGQYPGMVVGPLKTANFDPDLTMIYCNPAQLRHLLLALRYLQRDPGDLDPRSHRFLRAFCHPFAAVRGMQGHRARSRRFRACRRSGRRDGPDGPDERDSKELMDGVYHLEESGMGLPALQSLDAPRLQAAPVLRGVLQEVGPGRSQRVDVRADEGLEDSARPRPKSGGGPSCCGPASRLQSIRQSATSVCPSRWC